MAEEEKEEFAKAGISSKELHFQRVIQDKLEEKMLEQAMRDSLVNNEEARKEYRVQRIIN